MLTLTQTRPSAGSITNCPKCKGVIRTEDINVVTDIALCRVCNVPHKFSALVRNVDLETGLDLQRPPAGAWYQSSPLETVIGATHRSAGAAAGLLAVSLFWNGIISVFVLLATSSTLSLLAVPVPEWFPAPKMNGGSMGVGVTIFLWIFLTPFILIGMAMIAGFLSSLGGQTEIRVRGGEGTIFSGIKGLGWKRKFKLMDVTDVRIFDQSWRDSDGDARRKTNIVVENTTGKEIKFGSMLTEERRKFVAAALRNLWQMR